MSIAPFNASTYLSDRNTANLVGLKGRLDTLTNQLASGRSADTYGGIGAGRTTSLSAHAALSALDGYDAAIAGATTRVALANASVTQINTLGSGLQRSLTASNTSTAANTAKIARDSLDAAIDALNVEVAGQYIFGGRATDSPPVAPTDTILNGDAAAGLDGLKVLIVEQKAADLGSGNGRVSASPPVGSTVTLSEEGTGAAGMETRANFGFRLLGATSSNPNAIRASAMAGGRASDVSVTLAQVPKEGDRIRITLNQPDGSQTFKDYTIKASAADNDPDALRPDVAQAELNRRLGSELVKNFGEATVAGVQGPASVGITATFANGTPASLTLGVNGTPAAGDAVTVTVALRDGTTQTLTLTAKAGVDAASATEFSMVGDTATIAQNLSNAVNNALKGAASTSLSASSASRATQDFFAGSVSPGLAPRRINADRTGYAEQASARTVIWYTGDDTASDPRATATAQVSANRVLNIGVQANEAPIRAVLSGLAMMAADGGTTAAAAGTTEATRFRALSDRARTLLVSDTVQGGVPGIASDLGLAASTLSNTKSDNRASRAALETSLDGIDTISAETVTAQLLQLQTQLQASYQVTSMLSKLNLVNYLS